MISIDILSLCVVYLLKISYHRAVFKPNKHPLTIGVILLSVLRFAYFKEVVLGLFIVLTYTLMARRPPG